MAKPVFGRRCVIGGDWLCSGATCLVYLVFGLLNVAVMAPRCPYLVVRIICYIVTPPLCIACTVLHALPGLSDPGYMPLNERYLRERKAREEASARPPAPNVNEQVDYIINGDTYSSAVCRTCGVSRPPGTSHCDSCGRCVVYLDHHCPWIGTDVGLRNYRGFLQAMVGIEVFCGWILLSTGVVAATTLTQGINRPVDPDDPDEPSGPENSTVALAGLALHLASSEVEGGDTADTLLVVAVTLASIVCAVFGLIFSSSMLCYNLRLVRSDTTTRANKRGRANVAGELEKALQSGSGQPKHSPAAALDANSANSAEAGGQPPGHYERQREIPIDPEPEGSTGAAADQVAVLSSESEGEGGGGDPPDKKSHKCSGDSTDRGDPPQRPPAPEASERPGGPNLAEERGLPPATETLGTETPLPPREITEDEFLRILAQIEALKAYRTRTHPGWRRVHAGGSMPRLVHMDPDEAEKVAWVWTVALCADHPLD